MPLTLVKGTPKPCKHRSPNNDICFPENVYSDMSMAMKKLEVKGDEIEGWRLSRVEMLMLMHAIIGNRKDRKSYGG